MNQKGNPTSLSIRGGIAGKAGRKKSEGRGARILEEGGRETRIRDRIHPGAGKGEAEQVYSNFLTLCTVEFVDLAMEKKNNSLAHSINVFRSPSSSRRTAIKLI